MGIKVANNAFATLAAGISSGNTSITLTTGQGARFPTLGAGDYFYATLIDISNNLEIVKCTARSGDVLTVVRAQEGTSARAYSTGDRIELRITAQTFVDASGIEDGEVTDAKIVTMSASKLTGRVPDANAPSGSVIQVVQNALTQQVSTTSTTDTTVISQSITPSSASSKIWVFATCPTLTGSSVETWFSLYRDSTQIVAEDKHGTTGSFSIWLPIALQRLDAPNTTSAITYSLRFKSNLAGTITYAGTGSGGTNNTQITLMEIAA